MPVITGSMVRHAFATEAKAEQAAKESMTADAVATSPNCVHANVPASLLVTQGLDLELLQYVPLL